MNEKDVRSTLPKYKKKEILKLEEKNRKREKKSEMIFWIFLKKTFQFQLVEANN